ncbi:hypothetical protein FA95DRAFT_1612708 [Auriscalpium vulgare]|uniref:Uncharacterized protein n=1 Tax=Auriscalpium vulgare TaxID=40419 RepID=A0ACB8R5F6_9AGAM|nr:hypothetical protein FA95DRAFT_1612708 [Auriscalpium vulgare]
MSLPVPSTQPLRSAMKHPSRPPTPATGSPPVSPYIHSSPLLVPGSSSTMFAHNSGSTQNSPSYFTMPGSSPSQPTGLALSTYSTVSPSQSTFLHAHTSSQGYTPKVSFDTFENPAASMFSFTLQVKSDGYERTRSTRVFLCASSPDESGRQALDWAIESLVQDGDELIVFRGVDQEYLEKDHDLVRDEARELLHRTQEKCKDIDPTRKLSLIVEFIGGKVTTTIDRLIALYRPDSVVVGTRGVRGMKQAWGAAFGSPGMGGVSKYCLSHSPVPIIVVRPESKVRKTLDKRRADPKRGTHFDEERLRRQRSHIPNVPITSTLTR